MTAVEWFAKQVLEYKNPTNLNGTDYILIPVDKIEFLQEQAKEMEKQHLYNFYVQGGVDAIMEADRNAEQYYNKTFKSE